MVRRRDNPSTAAFARSIKVASGSTSIAVSFAVGNACAAAMRKRPLPAPGSTMRAGAIACSTAHAVIALTIVIGV